MLRVRPLDENGATLESDWEVLFMSWDQVQVVVAVVVIILSIFSLVSSVRRDINEVGRLRFRWADLNILGLVLLMIGSIFSISKGPRGGIPIFLTIIGGLCVLVAVIGLSMNRGKQQE
jgi:hypothetical protein